MTRTKADWRRVLLAARTAMDPSVRHARNIDLVDRVVRLGCFGHALTLFGYVAIGAEVDPQMLLERSRACHILMPAMTAPDADPRWCPWPQHRMTQDVDEHALAEAVRFPAVVLVPGVGFDVTGMRLGRGRGFYDRALATLRRAGDVCAVGLAFECQIVPALPGESWDQRMDFVVSENRIIPAAAGWGRQQTLLSR